MGVCIFFFKQKTAYEMRISDWSSDVCSSDLVAQPVDCPPSHARNTRNRTGAGSAVRAFHLRRHDRRLCAPRRLRYADRKSVVTGKSVSVRVDPGGRRIITKKINYTSTRT